MKKDTHIFTSFKFAYNQINRAIEAEFYFEAITIEERILTHRLFEVLRTVGFSQPLQKTTLEDLILFLCEHQDKVADLVPGKPFSFLNSLEQFWSGRNTCFHEVVPSKPAGRKMDILEFLAHARRTVDDGKRLSREITTWANAFMKANSKSGQNRPG